MSRAGPAELGLALPKALLSAGMRVAIADIRDDHLAQAVAGIKRWRESVMAVNAERHRSRRFCRRRRCGGGAFWQRSISLINNAGVAVVGPTELATFADWDWVMGVNLGGAINGVTVMLPKILSAWGGRAYRQHLFHERDCARWRHDDLLHGQGGAGHDDGMYAARAWSSAASFAARFAPARCNRTLQRRAKRGPPMPCPNRAMPRRIRDGRTAANSFTCTKPRKRWGSACCRVF